MGRRHSKEVRMFLARCRDAGLRVQEEPNQVLISDDTGGREWSLDRSSSGLNRVRLIRGTFYTDEDHEDKTGRLLTRAHAFGDDLNGHRQENLWGDLAKSVGLDLRNHLKKSQEGPSQEEPRPEEETVHTPTPAPPSRMKRVVDEILTPQSLVQLESLLHNEVLKTAREEHAPVQWREDKAKKRLKYLDWEGDITAFFAPLWDDFDATDTLQMARLEKELPYYLSRIGNLERIHSNVHSGLEVWRVFDDGRVLDQQVPVFPEDQRKVDAQPVQPEEVKEPEAAVAAPAPAPAKTVPTDKDIIPCKKCGFADYSPQSVAMHNTQLRDNANDVHPKQTLKCVLCECARNTVAAIQVHMRKHDNTGTICYPCAEGGEVLWFTENDAYQDHLENDPRHRGQNAANGKRTAPLGRRNKRLAAQQAAVEAIQEPLSEPQVVPKAPEALVEEVPVTTALERSQHLSGTIVNPADTNGIATQAAIDLIMGLPTLIQSNADLTKENAELRSRLGNYGKLVDDLDRERGLRKAAEEKLAAINEAQAALQRLLGN